MAVRFKFRSSVDFDSIDIDGRPFISVRDLRSKILAQKNMKIGQDFDLVISDADTGEEYKDENYLVPSCASVIIKRVPAGRSVPSILPPVDLVQNSEKRINFARTIESTPCVNVDVENFDDFGIDLYPTMGTSLLDYDSDVDKMNCISNGKADNLVPRCSEPSIARHQNPESSDHSEAIEGGAMHCGIEYDTSQTKLKSKMEEHTKLDNVVNASSLAMPKTDLPSELRCSLCNMIFKEAVMIPCCQHSFCEKCICLVLVEKARCPKCSSTKCRVEDLLPNVSLRQAIEHFLESQVLISGSDNMLPKYAPDGESGILEKEVSCAVSICQKEPILPHSPSVTGKGSNQVMTESPYELMVRNNGLAACKGSHIIHLDVVGKSAKSASSSHKVEQMRNGENDAVARPANFRSAPEVLESVADFQGESQPLKLPPNLMQKEEASSTAKKKKGLWVNTADGAGCFTATSRHRKGDRTCYMCGSPDHFIRDCPAASNPYPMLQTGDAMFPGGMSAYGPHYWHGASLPNIRPFANVYATSGVMPFNPTMVPVTPYRVPSYMPSMYAGLSVPCGLMRMGGMVPPMVTGAEQPVSRAEIMELQDGEQRLKLLNAHQHREKLRDGSDLEEGYYYNEPQGLQDCKPQFDREKHVSYSESDTRISQKKHTRDKHSDYSHPVDQGLEKGSRSSATGRDRKACQNDASSSEIHDMADISNHHSKERHKHHHKISKKSERRGHCGNDSGRSRHHHSHKEASSNRKKVENDVQRHSRKHHDHSESGLGPNSSRDRKRQWIEKESSHSSRHSRHKVKSVDDQLNNERWEMGNGLDEDFRDEYHHHHKRKRNH